MVTVILLLLLFTATSWLVRCNVNISSFSRASSPKMLISTHERLPGVELAGKVTDLDARMKSLPPVKCNETKQVRSYI